MIPNPSEGKIRALFGTGKNAIMAKTTEIQQQMKLRRQHSDMGQPLQQPSTERGGPQSNSNERSLKDLQASGQRRRLRTAGNPIGIMD